MKTNKLIAEFMGGQRVLPDKDVYNMPTHNNLCYGVDELHYHTSWDWLMPVVEKMNTTELWEEYDISYLATYLVSTDINATYNAVIEFINEYNKNK